MHGRRNYLTHMKKLTGTQWIQLGEMAEQNGEPKIAETAYSTFP